MKTSKRKRSAKAAPAVDASGVDAVVVETPAVVEIVAEPVAELSQVAVEMLVGEPAAAAPVVDAVAETTDAAVEAVAQTAGVTMEDVVETTDAVVEAVAEIADVVVEAAVENSDAAVEVIAETADPTAETVVVEEAAADAVVAEAADITAETVVADTAEPAAVEPAQIVDPVVVLAANCSVKDAAALKTSLCALAQQSTDVTLDVSAVERVDTATMQLLCAFVRDRSGRNQSVTWRGESQALQDAVRLLGVEPLLGFEPRGVAA